MKKFPAYMMLLLSCSWLAAQSHFIPVWTGNGVDHMNFYITKATIDGENMQAGDEIGIFDSIHCVGAGLLTGEIIEGVNYLALVASKNDALSPEVNGYTPGNKVIVKLWDGSEQLEIADVDVTYLSGTDIFSIGGTASFSIGGYSPGPPLPVANAGEDQQVNEGDTVALDGTGSYDPLEAALTYLWSAGPGIVLDDSSSATPGFIAPEVEEDTTRGIILVVNNGTSDSEPDTVIVTVLDVNKIPVITGQSELSTEEEVPLTLSLTDIIVEDPDNHYPDDFTLSAGEGDHYTVSGLELTPGKDFYGTLEIPVTVSDGEDESEPFTLVVSVINVNDPPCFTAFPADTTIDRNSLTIFLIKARDADPEDALSISVSIDPSISQVELTETGNGEAELSVTPGTGDPSPVVVTVSLTDNLIGTPLEQDFILEFSPTGIVIPGSVNAVSVRFDPAGGQIYLRNNLEEKLEIEWIRITGGIFRITYLQAGQEKGIYLPESENGICLLRFTGSSYSGILKVPVK